MSKVTDKLQVTLPQAIAERFGIRPGDEVLWDFSGDLIRLVVTRTPSLSREDRLELFDRATQRQRERETRRGPLPPAQDRGWKREDLYDRGSPR
jgi:AbrB family looped-hinge helix DNA binding protein